MATRLPPKGTGFRWTSLRGFARLFVFLIIVVLAEYLVVLYATSLGVKDESVLQGSFNLLGTDWNVTLSTSPLFHLVPVAVIIALVANWAYLTGHIVTRQPEPQKPKFGVPSKRGWEQKISKFFGRIKRGLSRARGIAYLEKKTHSVRATIRSAIIVMAAFLLPVIAISLLAYPQALYKAIIGAYQNNHLLLGFVKGTGNTLAPIGSVFSSANNALLGASPSFRDFVLRIADSFKPLTGLDNAGKYLVFQNVAVWISACIILFYGEFGHKSYQRRRK